MRTTRSRKFKEIIGNVLSFVFLPVTMLFPTKLSTETLEFHLCLINGEYKVIQPSELNNKRLKRTVKCTLLSDFHAKFGRPMVDPAIMRECIEKSNGFEPDMVFLTGDYVDYDPDSVTLLTPQLGKLESKSGTFAVLGNHDYKVDRANAMRRRGEREGLMEGSQKIKNELSAVGVRVLTNQVEYPLERDEEVAVVGVGDSCFVEYKPEEVLKKDSLAPLTIVLSHNPNTAYNLARFPFTLQLSGHTHGGQVCFPFTKRPFMEIFSMTASVLRKVFPKIPKKVNKWQFAQGLHSVPRREKVGENMIYTSRGLATHPPLRLFCDPEITFISFHLYEDSSNE